MKNYIYVVLLLLLCSCGARKSEVHKTETESKSETSITQHNDVVTEVQTETITESESETFIITPVDNTRPIEIIKPDGSKTTITNGRIEKKKEKQETKHNTQAKTADKSTATIKHQEESKKSITDKKKETKPIRFPWWGWLIIAVSAYFTYRYIKKWFV